MDSKKIVFENDSRAKIILGEIVSTGRISTTNDAFAKKLFSHKEIFLDFLNSILERQGKNLIVDLTYIDTEQHAENTFEKISRLDICCTLGSGEIIDLEVQVANDPAWIGRSLFYWAKLYTGSLLKGDSYGRLRPVICIHIMKFNLFKDQSKTDVHSVAKICNIKEKEPITDLLELHFLELQKFKVKKLVKMSRAEKWLAYFAGKLSLTDEKTMLEDKIFGKAIGMRNDFMKDPDNYAAYLNREMEILDYKSVMANQREEGREEGLAEGISIGEEKTTLKILKNMVASGLTPDEALKQMGIPNDKWDGLKEKLK